MIPILITGIGQMEETREFDGVRFLVDPVNGKEIAGISVCSDAVLAYTPDHPGTHILSPGTALIIGPSSFKITIQ